MAYMSKWVVFHPWYVEVRCGHDGVVSVCGCVRMWFNCIVATVGVRYSIGVVGCGGNIIGVKCWHSQSP